MLSHPSSLQGLSDIPSTRSRSLAGFIQLERRLPPSECGGNGGTSAKRSFPLLSHAADPTPGLLPVHLPFSSRQVLVFPFVPQGRQVSRFIRPGLSLSRTLPVMFVLRGITGLHHSFSYYSLRLWPALLSGYDSLHTRCRRTVLSLPPRT
jgi:hypothetical protein